MESSGTVNVRPLTGSGEEEFVSKSFGNNLFGSSEKLDKLELVVSQAKEQDSENGFMKTPGGSPSVQLDLKMTNRAGRQIHLPVGLSLPYLTIICCEIGPDGKVAKEMNKRICMKMRSLDSLEQKVLAPNESIVYKNAGDLGVFYSLEWSKTYHVGVRFNASMEYEGHSYSYLSNPCVLEIKANK